MQDYLPSYFYLNLPFYIIFSLAVLSAIYTYYHYRKTTPPVSEKTRYLLGFIRGLAVFLIMSLLFAPELLLVWNKEIKPEIIIATDKSGSMRIKDNGKERFEIAQSITEQILSKMENTATFHTYYFDSDTTSANDSINARKLGSNIESAINKLSTKYKNAENIILISDGVITEGNNPLFTQNPVRTIVHTIGIGDTIDAPDIMINNISANKTVYKNKPTKIIAEISTKNLAEFETTIGISKNNKLITAKNIDIKKSDEIIPVEFEITPTNTGLINYKIKVTGFENEKFTENNNFEFQLEVLKNKVNIGLLADKPGYDTKFIKQIFKSEKYFVFSDAYETSPNSNNPNFIQKLIDSSDVLILFDYPSKKTPKMIVNFLNNSIENKRMPVCYFVPNRPNNNYNETIKKRFWKFSTAFIDANKYIFARPTFAANLHPVFNIFENAELNENFWANAAPIEYNFNSTKLNETDKILLQSKSESSFPILILNKNKGTLNLMFLGAGFWRWKFLLAENRELSSGYDKFITNLFKWMSQNQKAENLNIKLNKKALPLGEKLNLNLELYDVSFNPVDGAEVKLFVNSPSGEFIASAENISSGSYKWQYTPFQEGKYTIKAEAYKNDVFLGQSDTEFNVLPVNKEFLYTKQDADFLKKLAASTGGKNFNETNFMDVVPELPKIPKDDTIKVNYILWDKLYTLLLIILLLSAEWFIRKRKGLA